MDGKLAGWLRRLVGAWMGGKYLSAFVSLTSFFCVILIECRYGFLGKQRIVFFCESDS